MPSLFFAAWARADSAQAHAFAINEIPSNPQGQRQAGSVVWRIDRIKTAGQRDELVIHAEVGIPEMNLTMTMDFKLTPTNRYLPVISSY